MTNFAKIMHDWQRMCKYYDKLYEEKCCDYCPIEGCGAIWEMEDKTNWEDWEKKIIEFSREHPEPKYPTWREHLRKMGLLTSVNTYFIEENGAGLRIDDALNEKADCPIPPEIATALGLEPHYD